MTEPECQLRRRRTSANPNIPLNLEVEFQVDEGDPDQGTPSPSKFRDLNSGAKSSASALRDFKNKQQSFDMRVEEYEEEEIIIDSDDEDERDTAAGEDRGVTPTPFQDFGASVVHTEGKQSGSGSNFLQVKATEQECYTDVSDAETEEEEEEGEEE